MSQFLRYKQCRTSAEVSPGALGMPRAKKKVADNAKSLSTGRPVEDSFESLVQAPTSFVSSSRSNQNKAGQRKRGWRDIEAIRERARLKKMLVDIWHEDIELDDDIFGNLDHLSGYYANYEEEEEEIEIDEELIDDEEDFEEEGE
jgi:hypothetical protein